MAPSSSLSPTKKLLIADPKPKSDPKCASSSSTTSTPPPSEKRTRDHLNLSDCHGCDRRINYTNPKDRLQPLDSVWRIVLLCRKCRKSVHSGRTCPYCFQGTENSGDIYACRVCERKIHKNCVRDYGNCTPWRYVGGGLEGFRVCIDCWVPEMLKNSIRRSDNKGGSKEKGEAKDMLENAVQEAKCRVEKKIKRVSKAKENVLRQADGEMHAVQLADGESDFLGKKDVDSLKGGSSTCSSAFEVVDDAELAIHLHRVINSSTRISRGNKSSLNSDPVDAIRNWKGLSYKRSGLRNKCIEDQKHRTFSCAENERKGEHAENVSSIVFGRLDQGLVQYKRDRKRKIWQVDIENNVVSESTASQRAELKNLHLDDAGTRCSMKSGADRSGDSVFVSRDRRIGDRFRQEVVSYKRTRFKKVCRGVSRDSSYCDGYRVAFKSDYCQPDDVNLGMGFPVKGDSKVNLASGICKTKQDRYHLKYVKRTPGTKRDSNFPCFGTSAAPAVSNSEAGHSMISGELILPNGNCNHERDRYSLKYAKRAKRSKSGSNSETELQSDAFLNKAEISAIAAALTMNCSAESRTLSDVSFDSFTVDLPK